METCRETETGRYNRGIIEAGEDGLKDIPKAPLWAAKTRPTQASSGRGELLTLAVTVSLVW